MADLLDLGDVGSSPHLCQVVAFDPTVQHALRFYKFTPICGLLLLVEFRHERQEQKCGKTERRGNVHEPQICASSQYNKKNNSGDDGGGLLRRFTFLQEGEHAHTLIDMPTVYKTVTPMDDAHDRHETEYHVERYRPQSASTTGVQADEPADPP